MGLGIGERQGRSPGRAESDPALDTEHVSQGLDIRDQSLGRVGFKREVRGRPAGAALVHQGDAITLGIEELAVFRGAAGTRPAMQDDEGDSLRIADLFPVQFMPVAGRQPACAEGFGRREKGRTHE